MNASKKTGPSRRKKSRPVSPAYNRKSPFQSDVVLVESSENDDESDLVVVESDGEDAGESAAENTPEPPRKRQKVAGLGNEVTQNNDFIGFGFSSSEEENNGESLDGEDEENEGHSAHRNVQGDKSLAFPWVKDQNHLKQKEIADWLTLEIKDFVNYISPSKNEIMIRNEVISSLKSHIASFWPETQAHVFGSCATDLYLPGSDIDMVVISTTGDYEQRLRLYQLSSYLRTHKLAKNIEVIALAKVPIIKFVDPKHNIHVDVSFERTNGIDAARRIRRWLETNPGLRELVLIVKQFLRSRMLNNVHVGGLGGYATIIMVYHFLKMHPRVASGNLAARENLGTLLIEFFELYGRNFSYDNLIIALDPKNDSPKYLRKYRYPALSTGRSPFTIVIQDPSDPDNNITRSSYNLRDLKKAFGGAFQLLTAKCYELNSTSYKNRLGQLILGDIITYKGKDRDFNDDRDKVVNSALINHESSDSESDGAEGNDKYYFSDMTAESEGDTYISAEEKTKQTSNLKTTTKAAQVLEADSEEEEEEKNKSKANLEKQVKREFWKLKGLEVE
ncbi:Nucleotidyltransferase [Metschnikowia bicuspidata var. bicuspidata NRRL YB-4993]|uniref:polynucleotide adenylyltransferase n=1 Tax=Metschnikowia bicuspidata var. bicuspidata NRRL YB-4993 TaxID=869754 RepID=A0A1A0HG99_9ASCO|nr:Nucleotidyltransferase [Metschnikowia bicuspidata var. bicuspidata NRRL YB-4993]OBA23015.1 Nucleotidyltransferase [Metschnikowia bicuspidata var. bicuspidata NRRL YB-4993]